MKGVELSLRRASFLIVFLIGSLAGCAEREEGEVQHPDSTGVASEPEITKDRSTTVEIARSPVGRTSLPTLNTGAGPLFISLPGGFSVRVDSGYHADLIFLYRTEDPLVEGDLTNPPIAIARLHISDSTIDLRTPGRVVPPMKGVVAGIPMEYTHTIDDVPGVGPYHSYSSELRNFFAPRDPDPEIANLHLHLYVGGSDTNTLTDLLHALSTLSFQP